MFAWQPETDLQTELLRRGFLTAGVPVFLKGTGGPRAPHVFELDRRGNLGCSEFNDTMSTATFCDCLALNWWSGIFGLLGLICVVISGQPETISLRVIV